MEIIWYGHACFRLKGREGTVVTDPYDKTLGLNLPRLKADIVTISRDTPHHNYTAGITGNYKVIDSPGEYEINNIFITSLFIPPSKKDNGNGSSKNNIFVVYIDDVTVCHLGQLSHVPSQSQVEDLSNIDVLLIPVGGQQAMNAAEAAEVISLIEPYTVIPMHYRLPNLTLKLDPVSKFLKEMGITKNETVDSLRFTKINLPDETQIVVLEAKS